MLLRGLMISPHGWRGWLLEFTHVGEVAPSQDWDRDLAAAVVENGSRICWRFTCCKAWLRPFVLFLSLENLYKYWLYLRGERCGLAICERERVRLSWGAGVWLPGTVWVFEFFCNLSIVYIYIYIYTSEIFLSFLVCVMCVSAQVWVTPGHNKADLIDFFFCSDLEQLVVVPIWSRGVEFIWSELWRFQVMRGWSFSRFR